MNILSFKSAPGLTFILAPRHVFVIDLLEATSYALTHEEFVSIVLKIRSS